MRHVIKESATTPGEWRVECVNEADEGQVTVVILSGYKAEQLAKDYAANQNRREWGVLGSGGA